jgi:hypothetical protein
LFVIYLISKVGVNDGETDNFSVVVDHLETKSWANFLSWAMPRTLDGDAGLCHRTAGHSQSKNSVLTSHDIPFLPGT